MHIALVYKAAAQRDILTFKLQLTCSRREERTVGCFPLLLHWGKISPISRPKTTSVLSWNNSEKE